jgi:hypothetical protein
LVGVRVRDEEWKKEREGGRKEGIVLPVALGTRVLRTAVPSLVLLHTL